MSSSEKIGAAGTFFAGVTRLENRAKGISNYHVEALPECCHGGRNNWPQKSSMEYVLSRK
jgi:hypothetical protein